ncbi:hypothetical protein BESB_026340 [Besnoitia besnoiti]|uniref:Sec1 family protein n=1 Tax=Besnoitia besnoiti TaxID=94643 RepID=A0A2A9M8E7_BESBE|nr:uncharacterized protein BESB_026340 [Besnoitia besnoiti]PFH31660.1 hypothetical protein BESB_026340 [Besnoitia besnoiti]
MMPFSGAQAPASSFPPGAQPPPAASSSSWEAAAAVAASGAPQWNGPVAGSAAAAATASAGAVTAPITAFSRRCFLDSLSTLVGRKLLLLDETLAGPLSLLVDTTTLQQHGVDRCYPLRAFPVPARSLAAGAAAAPFVVFVCRPRLALLPLIVQHIHFIEKTYEPTQPPSHLSASFSSYSSFPAPSAFSPSGRHYFVLFVPSSSDFLASELRRLLSNPPPVPSSLSAPAPSDAGSSSSLISNLSNLPAALTNTLMLSSSGGAGSSASSSAAASSSALQLNLDSTTVAGCPLYFFPLAPDVLSMELPNSFRDIHISGDPSPCLFAAASVQLLQQELQQSAVIPHLRCLGSAAKTVADHLIQQRKEKQAAAQQQALWGEPGGPPVPTGLDAWANGGGRGGQDGGRGLFAGGEVHGFGREKEDEHDEIHAELAPVAPPVRFVLSKEDLGAGAADAAEGGLGGAGATRMPPGGAPDASAASKGAASSAGGNADPSSVKHAESAPTGLSEANSGGDPRMGARAGSADASAEAVGGRPKVHGDGEWVAGSPPSAGLRGPPETGGGLTACGPTMPKIDMLVLVDRRSDLITPLCSAFTYEALLDLVFGIDSAALEVPRQLLHQQSASGAGGVNAGAPGKNGIPVLLPGGRRQKVPLSSDGLFATLRDLHQSAVGGHLHRVANEIQQTYKEKDKLRSIQEISVFMNKFKVKQQEHSSLSLHVRLASFLASVTKDPAFFKRLTLEDELLQSAGSGAAGAGGFSGGTLSASALTQLENMIDATAPSGDLWWSVPGASPFLGSHAPGGEDAPGSGGSGGAPGAAGRGGGVGGLAVHPARPAAAPCVEDVYRLLCLASVVNGGLRGKQLETLRRGLVQQHGLKEAARMARLQKVGLLRQSDGTGAGGGGSSGSGASKGGGNVVGSWKTLKKECNLMVEEEQSADDIAYACSGYAPLSVRLLQFLHEQPNGWRSIPHILSLLWGPAMEVRQQQPAAGPLQAQQRLLELQRLQKSERAPPADGGDSSNIMTVMVMYLGGVTYAEIAAIRKLNELEVVKHEQHLQQQELAARQGAAPPPGKPPTRRRYIIVTTEITNYKKLLASCGDAAEDPCERFPWRAVDPN